VEVVVVPAESTREIKVAIMIEQNKNTEAVAKPYEAPKIIRVSLRPDEAVLGHCKIPTSAGPAATGCGVAVGGCSSFGS
jgi:hypothetical protein